MAEVISRGRKWTTLEELEKADRGPVWVLNNTRDSLEGKVVISIPKKNGNGADIVRVPKSFIPFDITQQVPRMQVLDSADFRKTINTRLLKLVTPEYAAVLLSTEEAKEEITRLRNEEQKARMALKKAGVMAEQSSGVGEDDEDDFFDVATEGSKKKAPKAQAQATKTTETKPKKGPSIKVQNLVARAHEDEMSETQIVAKLKNISNLRKADLAFLSREFTNKTKVMKHLKAVLKELNAETA
jgi:hypothetical protein